jgi:hypothetical protein
LAQGSQEAMTNKRRRDNAEAAKRDADDFSERLLARMREDAAKKPKSGVHLIGDRGVRTWCGVALAPVDESRLAADRPLRSDGGTIRGVIRIADTFDQASCDECIELLQLRRVAIASGAYRHPLDAKLDAELGVHRPDTLST